MNIDDVYVSEQYRGKKIGEVLMSQATEVGQKARYGRIRWKYKLTITQLSGSMSGWAPPAKSRAFLRGISQSVLNATESAERNNATR